MTWHVVSIELLAIKCPKHLSKAPSRGLSKLLLCDIRSARWSLAGYYKPSQARCALKPWFSVYKNHYLSSSFHTQKEQRRPCQVEVHAGTLVLGSVNLRRRFPHANDLAGDPASELTFWMFLFPWWVRRTVLSGQHGNSLMFVRIEQLFLLCGFRLDFETNFSRWSFTDMLGMS